MTVHWEDLAATQLDLVARWQLLARGTLDEVEWLLRDHDWRRMHDGVYATNLAPPTAAQELRAATLTAPETVLSHASAAHWWGVRWRRPAVPIVVRPGSGGPKLCDGVLVCRSARLTGNTTVHEGVPITTIERTLIDLAGVSRERDATRAVRDALRLRRTTAAALAGALHRHRGARGTALLRQLVARYARLELGTTQSDAESYALELIACAGLPVPDHNVDIAGEEADLVWRDARVILEIDGPQFHLFREEDERKERLWRAAGWTVLRLPSDDVYDRPERLLALVPR